MASIKQLDERRYKITVSNGYRPNGKKISKAKTIQVPPGVPKRGIGQYVVHAAEELARGVAHGVQAADGLELPVQALVVAIDHEAAQDGRQLVGAAGDGVVGAALDGHEVLGGLAEVLVAAGGAQLVVALHCLHGLSLIHI